MGEMERPMTDHYTEATELIRRLPPDLPAEGILAIAQVHATLALAEQQRIANLIAPPTGHRNIRNRRGCSASRRPNRDHPKDQPRGPRIMYRLRPDIARALRIETPNE